MPAGQHALGVAATDDDILSQGEDREPSRWHGAGYQFTRVNGGWAVHASSAGQTQCGDCADVRSAGASPSMRLEVASVGSGRLTAVPGASAGSDVLVDLGWPTSGDRLVAEFIFATRAQLASWHPGATRPAVAVIPPGQDQTSLVVG